MDYDITLRKLHHRKNNCIGMFFPINKAIETVVRQIPDVKFSITHRCWYVIENDDALRTVLAKLSQNKLKVDYSEFNLDKRVVFSDPNPRELAKLQLVRHLKLKGYSNNTIHTYFEQFKLFLEFFPQSNPEELGEQEIQAYLLFLIDNKRLSISTQNQAINAIKFYFEKVLKQERKVYYVERPFKEHKLPTVISQEEIISIFENCTNLKHRLILMLIYSAGLRRSELLNLKVADLDMQRMTVRVKGGKGKKDRQSILAQSLMPMLKQYLSEYEPVLWLFTGNDGTKYSESSLHKILKQAVQRAGLKRDVTLHTLRHSFATHLLESGTSTRYIQVLLGHESPKTTEIYAHVTKFGMDKLRSPLDMLSQDKKLNEHGDD